MGGALFVYSVIDLAGNTIKRLDQSKKELESLVHERTSELLQTNKQLESSHEKYRRQNIFLENILDSLSHPFYVIDVNTYEVILYNKASGFQGRNEKTCHQLTHDSPKPCSGADHPCTIKTIKETRKPAVLEHLHHDGEGNDIHVEVYGYPIFGDSGELTQIIEYVHDISERKISEQSLLLAKQEAEAANKTKSEFLANISHEIRTPMNAILGMTELALASDLSKVQREYLQTVKDSSDLLLNLINDILDFSKIEAGRLQLDVRPFNIREIIAATIQPLQHIADEKGIGVGVHCRKELINLIFMGDDLRLRQILFNLIGNAIKFTETGNVDIYCTQIGEIDEKIDLQFSVRDTGIGIEREHYETIFESFGQADSSTTRNHGGTGLGLAICKMLVEMMGGEIWVESTVGKGSVFYFELSLTTAEEVVSEKARSETAIAGSITAPLNILVVDDISANRDLVRMILQQHDHNVAEACNGYEALEMLSQNSFDAVFLDVQMPVLDGIKTAEAIRSCEQGGTVSFDAGVEGLKIDNVLQQLQQTLRGKYTPLLALTARATVEDKQRCFSAGMDQYISKPFHPDEIMRGIIELTGRMKKQ